MSQVSYGTITITDTTDKTVYIAYASNAQGANFSPNPASNLTYVGINVSTAQSMPSAEDPGWTWSEYIGTDGLSVTSTTDIYYLKVNTNPTKRADDTPLPSAVDSIDTWSLQVPTYVTNGEYWISTVTTLSSGKIVYSTPVKDLGLTSSNSKAEIALQNANIAKTATDLLGGHFIYKSTNTVKDDVITTPSGAGVIQNIADDPANWGYNTWIGSNGIQLRRGEVADATLNANGLKLLKGGIEAGTPNQSGFIYLSTEPYGSYSISNSTGITDWKEIIGTKFGVREDGTLYASNVVIEGKITVGSGSNVYTITEANATFDTKESAEQVRKSAESAARSANSALTQLGVVEDVVNTINWLAEHGNYSITEDTVAQSDKLYYERLYIYTKTTDTSIDSTKTYYTQSGTGTDADPYVYTAVENPVVADIENYYEATASYAIYDVPEDGNPHELGLYQLDGVDEAVTNYIASHIALTDNGLWITADDNGYRILISSDGIRLYSPEGVISTFGENIEFDSSKSQRIGGENEYIEFDHTTGRLNIVADSVSIGSRDASTAFDSIENTLTPMQDQLESHDEALQNQQNTLNNLTGYVDINTEDSYIRVGKRDADSYVQIDGADTKVAININGKDVAYMNGNRFYAPSAVVTNLYMKTEDNTIGTIGWVMRSNGHLSLKRLR